VERLELEVGLEVAQLGDLRAQPVLAERRAGLAPERLEQLHVVAAEAPARPGPVDHQHRAEQALLARQRGEHRLARAEPPQVRDLAGATLLERHGFLERFGDAAVRTLQERGAIRPELIGARRLFSRLRQVALEAADERAAA